MIYIASPYSDPDDKVMEQRYLKVLEFTAMRLKEKIVVFSPIVHCHELAKKFDMPKDHKFWKGYNEQMIELANELHVLLLDGWENSKGVAAEIELAYNNDIDVIYYDKNFNEIDIPEQFEINPDYR